MPNTLCVYRNCITIIVANKYTQLYLSYNNSIKPTNSTLFGLHHCITREYNKLYKIVHDGTKFYALTSSVW